MNGLKKSCLKQTPCYPAICHDGTEQDVVIGGDGWNVVEGKKSLGKRKPWK